MFFSYWGDHRLIGHYFLKTAAYSTHSSLCHISLICWRLHCFFAPPHPFSCEQQWDKEAVSSNITCPVPHAPTEKMPLCHKAAVTFVWLYKKSPKARRQHHCTSRPGRTIKRHRRWQQCSIIEKGMTGVFSNAAVYIIVSTWYCALSLAHIINSITAHLAWRCLRLSWRLFALSFCFVLIFESDYSLIFVLNFNGQCGTFAGMYSTKRKWFKTCCMHCITFSSVLVGSFLVTLLPPTFRRHSQSSNWQLLNGCLLFLCLLCVFEKLKTSLG